MDSAIWWSLCSILFLIIFSAFMSASETALTAASRSKMHQLAKQGNKRAGVVNTLRHQSELLISSILIGNTLANVLSSAIMTGLMILYMGEHGVAYASVLITIVLVLFAEILPKTYAINHPEKMALRCAPLMRVFVMLCSPLSLLSRNLARKTLELFGTNIANNIGKWISDDELRGAIDLHSRDEDTQPQESAMLRSILDLDEVSVADIMIHRKDLVMIDINAPVAQIVDQVISAPYTRIPVYEKQPDNVIGLIHSRTLIRAFRANNLNADGLNIREIALEPWFIHESTRLLDQLEAFRHRKEHFAHVIDEYGALQGIVTLEDILEEIVGDILDEHDQIVSGIIKQKDGTYLLEGTVTIRDLNREFGWTLPDENASTIAGLVLHQCRDIPNPGQVFEFAGFQFKILRRKRNQITLLSARPLLKGDSSASSHSNTYHSTGRSTGTI